MDKIELLYDHYKDTCELQRGNLKFRNTCFIIVVIILGILMLLSYSPNTVGDIVLSILKHEYGIDAKIQLQLMQSMAWVLLLYVSQRYYQITINIERSYIYIHRIEECLNKVIADQNIVIDREGKSYLKNTPKLLDAIDFIYKWIFPLLYIVTISFKIIIENTSSIV